MCGCILVATLTAVATAQKPIPATTSTKKIQLSPADLATITADIKARNTARTAEQAASANLQAAVSNLSSAVNTIAAIPAPVPRFTTCASATSYQITSASVEENSTPVSITVTTQTVPCPPKGAALKAAPAQSKGKAAPPATKAATKGATK
jgi:hypothetical protein